MTIGQRIKAKRNELRISQRELAKRIGYADHSTITKIEAGKVDLPQSKIVQFAEVLNTSVSYLMGWDEIQKNNDTLSNIIVRLRVDNDFLSVVEILDKMDAEKMLSVKQLLSAFTQDLQN